MAVNRALKRLHRIAFGAATLLLSANLFAQVHGIPASVTSLSPEHGFDNPPGIPASVTSLGPHGFTPGFAPTFGPNFTNPRFDRFRRIHSTFFVPYVLPVYLTPYDIPEMMPADQPEQRMSVAPYQGAPNLQPAQPTVIVIDNRGVHEGTGNDLRGAATPPPASAPAPSAAQAAPASTEDGPPTTIIFRDGTRKEMQNYAIMSKELIDLTGGRMHRYPLNDLDIEATMKENDEHGVDFRLP